MNIQLLQSARRYLNAGQRRMIRDIFFYAALMLWLASVVWAAKQSVLITAFLGGSATVFTLAGMLMDPDA